MPELPEVETIRGDFAPLVAGCTVTGFEVDPNTPGLLGGLAVESLNDALAGHRVEALGRRGKYLLLQFGHGLTLVIHLRMTGRLVWREATAPEESFQRAVIHLDGGHDLRWADMRKFGTWTLVDSGDLDAYFAGRLGLEPLDDAFTPAYLRKQLENRSAPVKAVLLDQRRVAGLGNIYVDEALFQARIRPDTPAGDLGPKAIALLAESCRDVLERGIEHRGASFSDYVDGMGEQGQSHMHVQVFRRTGKPCYTCGTEITRSVVGGRATHTCRTCQRPARKRKRLST